MFGYSCMIPHKGWTAVARATENAGSKVETEVQLTVLIDFHLSD